MSNLEEGRIDGVPTDRSTSSGWCSLNLWIHSWDLGVNEDNAEGGIVNDMVERASIKFNGVHDNLEGAGPVRPCGLKHPSHSQVGHYPDLITRERSGSRSASAVSSFALAFKFFRSSNSFFSVKWALRYIIKESCSSMVDYRSSTLLKTSHSITTNKSAQLHSTTTPASTVRVAGRKHSKNNAIMQTVVFVICIRI